MKIFSSVFGLIVIALVVCFVLSNRQDVILGLWPSEGALQVPLYVVGFVPFALGGILGIFWGWMGGMPHRKRAKSLNKELASLSEKISELQKTAVVQQAKVKTKPFWKP